MLLLVCFLASGLFLVASSVPKGGAGNPENVTVHVIDSKTVEVFWSTSSTNVERYDITYNPTENRVVSQAAGNSRSIILRELRPNTQYQVTVTAVVAGKNYKSRRLVFRTSTDANDNSESEQKPSPTKASKSRKWHPQSSEPINPDPTAVGSKNTPPTSTTVRGVEIGLVLLALCVWMIAIALFFHRWGKIRMLLPYQPDYKTQQSLKVPGTGTSIVSGCTGNSNSQGQQDGAGCVQHLRWSSHYSDEASATAKKCSSPGRRQLRPRVSSAVFPSSPSYLYARTSADSDSPRMIRHAHSQRDFPTESISLCQVTQPRSDNAGNVISIAVPVIASNVNEKARNNNNINRNGESRVSETEKVTTCDARPENGEFFQRDVENCPCSLASDDSYKSSFYWTQRRSGLEESEKECKRSESRVRPCEDVDDRVTQQDKPKRYNRSSLRKQTVRLCEDPDSSVKPPIYESASSSEIPRKSANPKTAEMKRKAFLRKISLQDTHVNYNQDYWLDYKKSLRFHKSLDLGCFGGDEKAATQPEAITRQSTLSSRPGSGGNLKRSDSDPVIFPATCSCAYCHVSGDTCKEFTDLLTSPRKSFFQPDDDDDDDDDADDVPLFLDRNGLIDTDFDILEEEYRECRDFGLAIDLSEFYEIKLNNSVESESERVKQGHETLPSTSADSDVFYETDPLMASDERTPQFPNFSSSSSPPKSTPG